jgi:HSP20 family protein
VHAEGRSREPVRPELPNGAWTRPAGQQEEAVTMSLTRYRSPALRFVPFADDLEKAFRRIASETMEPVIAREAFTFVPAVAVVEKPEALIMTAELPGLKAGDVSIEVENNILTLKGEKKEEHEEKDARYHVWERSYGVFERSLPLPRTVNPDLIKAEFENGVLKIMLPKVAEAKGRKIEVKTP